jgi:putative two-component system response regulator
MENRKACIFLVDDSIVNLNAGKAALQHKYTVITVPSGEKLMFALKKVRPDLIMLDIEMPGMSGYEAIAELKSNAECAGIPVIFISGKIGPEDEAYALSLGAVDFIAKPFSQGALLEKAEKHMPVTR